MSNDFPYRHQPVKALYISYQLLTTFFVRLPIWTILAIPSAWRPRRSWSIKRTITVHLVRKLSYVASRTGPLFDSPNYLEIRPGVDVNGIWVEPAPPESIVGQLKIWADIANVAPIRLPGYWMHKLGSTIEVGAPPMPGEKVIYGLHGGGYTRLSAHPTDPTSTRVRGFLKHIDSVHRVFSIEYRLSSAEPYQPAHPFPAALLDAIAGYLYLVNVVGFAPADIIVDGDSAGGNLALALVRYLVEYHSASEKTVPPPPGALLLLSPWCDIGNSHNTPGSSAETFSHSDYINLKAKARNYPRRAFLGPHGLGAAEVNPYISPASKHDGMVASFKGFPRTFLVGGSAEVLIDAIRTLRDKMTKDLGKEGLTYYEAADAVHDYLCLGFCEPERTQTLVAIAKWVSEAPA